jgi:hypothetical protein
MKKKKIHSEREKGASPPDFMPSIFGWMTLEEQREHAREIVDFTNNLKSKVSDKKKL